MAPTSNGARPAPFGRSKTSEGAPFGGGAYGTAKEPVVPSALASDAAKTQHEQPMVHEAKQPFAAHADSAVSAVRHGAVEDIKGGTIFQVGAAGSVDSTMTSWPRSPSGNLDSPDAVAKTAEAKHHPLATVCKQIEARLFGLYDECRRIQQFYNSHPQRSHIQQMLNSNAPELRNDVGIQQMRYYLKLQNSTFFSREFARLIGDPLVELWQGLFQRSNRRLSTT